MNAPVDRGHVEHRGEVDVDPERGERTPGRVALGASGALARERDLGR